MSVMQVGTSRTGFTIVELLIVVVVIAILAAITIVAFSGIQQRALVGSVKSELANTAKLIELAKVETDTYPTVLPSTVPQSSTAYLSLSQTASGFCVNSTAKNNSKIQWRYESATGGIQEGLCSGQVLVGSEQGLNPNLITNTSFASGWSLNFQVGTGRTLTTRAGVDGDPYATRPVLVLQNTGTTATGWAVVQSSGVNRAEILNTLNFQRGYWVRKVGPYTGGIVMFGLMDGGATNQTLSNGASTTITTDWQYISQPVTAVRDATAGNSIYISTSAGAYTTAGWSLEFQGFELRRV